MFTLTALPDALTVGGLVGCDVAINVTYPYRYERVEWFGDVPDVKLLMTYVTESNALTYGDHVQEMYINGSHSVGITVPGISDGDRVHCTGYSGNISD